MGFKPTGGESGDATFTSITMSGDINMEGNDLWIDTDKNSGIVANGDDDMIFRIGGSNFMRLNGTAVGFSRAVDMGGNHIQSTTQILELGSAMTTSHGLGAGNTGVSMALEVDGLIYADGGLVLAENTSIALDPAGSADGKYTGITVTGTAGAILAFGDLIYLAVADSKWELADADAAATSGAVALGVCVLAAAEDASTTILLQGIVRADTAFPALTIGAPVYAGLTAGDIQVAAPSATDDVVRVCGFALTADEILFQPESGYITVV